jgi:hypothetical protein
MKKHNRIWINQRFGGLVKNRRFRLLLILLVSAAAVASVLQILALIYNNKSMQSDTVFADSIDNSIEKAVGWIAKDQKKIIGNPNIALLKMLDECDQWQPTPVFSEMIDFIMSQPLEPKCWKALIDPNRLVNPKELNTLMNTEPIDNKWTLYALAPVKSDLSPQQLGLFEHDRWQNRQLTHQLWALIHLKERTDPNNNIDLLIEHLSGRISKELFYDLAVVDIYIQKVVFVLRSGHPEKIRRRWIERIIENQHEDGGWNDKWFCFGSGRRPSFKPGKPTDSHATIQAVWLLYQVKYCYPQYFGLETKDRKPEAK